MSISKYEAIRHIVKEDKFINDWVQLNPKVFFKNDKPYGLIAHYFSNDTFYIASTTSEPSQPFTKEMIKWIMMLNNLNDIVIITDLPEYFDKIRKLLETRGFTITVEDGVMYSFREVN